MDSTTPVSDCTCHPSCYNCGYYDMPTAADDCITCADSNVQVNAVYSDGTGYCSTPPPPPPTTRAALAAACRYGDSASPDLSSPATLVVVRLNVTDSPEGTSVTHVGTSVTEDVADCHYVSQDRTAALEGWTCGVAADPGAYAVTGLLVRDASRSGAPAPRAPLTGPEPLQRRDFEGECECPLCYERFGFVDVLGVSDTAARDAALAAA